MAENDMHTNQALKDHVMSHVKYPATKAQILMACHDGETPADVLNAAEMHLQDKTYKSANEALKDLHMA
jgi:hypothetical protein